MLTTSTIILVIAMLSLAAMVRSTVGFGDALVGMSLLTLVVGVHMATPMIAFLSVTISLSIIWHDWRSIDFSSAWRLVAAAMIGIPIGVWLLKAAPEHLIVGFLGVSLALFGLYSLLDLRLPTLQTRGIWVYLLGFMAGCLGGAYNTHGPPVLIYGSLRRWNPARFRATLQGFFLPSGLIILASHGIGGLWTRQVVTLYALALLPVLAAIYLGDRLNRRIEPDRFRQLVNLALIALGIMLVVQAMRT